MLIEALKVVLLGMAVVFIVLSLLGIMLYLIGKITGKVSKASKINGPNEAQNNPRKSDDSTSNSDCEKALVLRSSRVTATENGSDIKDSSDLADDAFMVAAVAACHYAKNQRYAIRQERELSAWLLFGRRALLTNKPLRNAWRR